MLSGAAIDGANVRIGVASPLRLMLLQRSPRLLPLERVMTARTTHELDPKDVGLFYAQSWLLVHYLYFGKQAGSPDRSGQAPRYLALLNEGRAPEAACREAFGADFEELGREIEAYRRRDPLPSLALPLAALRPGRILSTRALPVDEALARVAELRLQVYDPRASDRHSRFTRSLFARALEVNPRNARALAGLAQVELDSRLAREGFEAALRLAPEDALLHATYGEWLRARLEDLGDSASPERRRELAEGARQEFEQSLALDPELPVAHAGLGATHLLDGSDPEEGRLELERARELLPGNLTIALWLGELHLTAGRPAQARSYLEDVERWSPGGRELERARQLLQHLSAEAAEPPAT